MTTEEEYNLDHLLKQWAERAMISPARAEAIRLAARATTPVTTPTITADWWRDLFAGVSSTVRMATDAKRYLKVYRATA